MTLFWVVFWAGLTGLVIIAGFGRRTPREEARAPEQPVIDDAAIETILRTGVLTTVDEPPLDRRVVEEEEQRFWSERWDEPDEL